MVADRARLACFSVVLFLLSTFPAFAAGVRIVRLSIAQGDVQIDRNAGDGWEQAIVNMPVIAGARLYAAENSKAELELEDGSSVRLVGPAQISLTELSSTPDGSPVNVIEVDSGVIYVDARLRHHEDFRITDYSGDSFAITKPSHLRFTVGEQTGALAMTDGEAVAESANPKATVHSGQTYNYILGQPASAARLDAVPAQPDDAWDQQRAAYIDQNANADQNAAAAVQYPDAENPNAPGIADLSNYGNYADVSGCGDCWQPNGVDQDWDPFDYGAWSYYPDWGWTFVSGYPWGWAPFYYGDWVWVGGRGWWWHPGPIHGHGPWHPRPLLAGAPHGFIAPHPPTGSAHVTVAVAGSHIPAGPIGVTHASAAANGFAGGSGIHASGPPAGVQRTEAVSTSSHAPIASHVGDIWISGRKGSYVVSGVGAGHSYQLPRAAGSNATAPRSYAYTGSVPSVYNVPVAPIVHTPVAPSVVNSAPRMSGGVGVVHSSGGGFSGGGISHGGAVSGGVAGGFHGGGGGGGGGHR